MLFHLLGQLLFGAHEGERPRMFLGIFNADTHVSVRVNAIVFFRAHAFPL